jgi:hypothetical protein
MTTHRISTLVLVFVTLGLGACASQPKSEADQYRDLRHGFKYKSYAKVSSKAMGPIVETYNKTRRKENKTQASENYAHSLAGFIWTLALEPDFAVAECNLALKKSDNSKERYISLSALAIAFHEKGWKQLAKQHSLQAKALYDSQQLKSDYKKERSIAFLIVGSLAIYEGDSVLAQDSFSELANLTDKPWLPVIAQGAALFNNGAYLESFRMIKGLADSDKLSDHEKKSIEKLQAKVKQAVEKGRSDLNISTVVSTLVFDALSEKGEASFNSLAESIRQFTAKQS